MTSSSDQATDDSKDDDCGCQKILEKRYSWWQGDYIYYEYLKCLEDCKKNKKCDGKEGK